MQTDWSDYQEEAAAHFRSIGFDASTNVPVQGVRTKHNVDVVVKSRHAGFEVTWLVECKHWKSPVCKLHVLALREIVADTGADRGILLCEKGFQSGAIEAANLTNVRVATLESVRASAGVELAAMRLRDLFDRVEACRLLYWEIPKQERIDRGLRQGVGECGYCGSRVIESCSEILARAFRGSYPFRPDTLQSIVELGWDREFASPHQVIEVLQPLVEELECKLAVLSSPTSA